MLLVVDSVQKNAAVTMYVPSTPRQDYLLSKKDSRADGRAEVPRSFEAFIALIEIAQ